MSVNLSTETTTETGGAAGASTLIPGYTGSLRDGVPHGMGRRVLANGRVEEGNFVDGQLHGRGKIINASGSIFEGQFNHGERKQFGTKRYTNGAVHIGFFDGEKANGPGKLQIEGKRYEGNFTNNKADGPIKIICADGRYIEREYKEGKAARIGRIVFFNSVEYEGRIKNKMPFGRGVWHFGDFSVPDTAIEFKNRLSFETNYLLLKNEGHYFGETHEGVPHGKGIVFYPVGSVVYGEYKFGKLHGSAVVRFNLDTSYEGLMDRGIVHGYGEYTSPICKGSGVFIKGELTTSKGDRIVVDLTRL